MDPTKLYEGRPCKACTSFEELMRLGKKAMSKGTQQTTETAQAKSVKPEVTSREEGGEGEQSNNSGRRRDCPVDKEQLGRSTWDLLHTMSVSYPKKPSQQEKQAVSDTLVGLSKTYPCPPCAEDFREDLRRNPPALESRDTFARWMCEAHNRVNEKLGKEQFDCARVKERWLDGWSDGSCYQ